MLLLPELYTNTEFVNCYNDIVTKERKIMTQFKNQIRFTIMLGILSILSGIFGHLALTDIYHGEGDLTLEWSILQAGAFIIFVFVVSSLLVLREALKAML